MIDIRLTRFLPLLALVSAALVGCGGDDDNDNNPNNDLVFSNVTGNANTETIPASTPSTVILNNTDTGANGFLTIDRSGITQTLSFDLNSGTALAEGETLNFANVNNTATFTEIRAGGTRTWGATTGTVTVESVSETEVQFRLNNVRFEALAGGDNGANGAFTLNGLVTSSVASSTSGQNLTFTTLTTGNYTTREIGSDTDGTAIWSTGGTSLDVRQASGDNERRFRILIDSALLGRAIRPGESFSAAAEDVTYAEGTDAATRVFEATGGIITIQRLNADIFRVRLNNVLFTPQSVNATGTFRVDGTINGPTTVPAEG